MPVKVGCDTLPVNVAGVPEKVGAVTEPAAVIVWLCVPSADPLNVGIEFEPLGVTVCVCVPSALPENVGWVNTPAAIVGTPAGHATVPAGVKAAVPFVPVAVNVWVWPERADPVKVCAVTVRLGAVALQAVVDPVPAAILVAAQFPLVALAPFVPAGVPAETELVVAELPVNVCAGTVPEFPVKVGTPAGQEMAPSVKAPLALVPAGVPAETALVVFESPVKVGAVTVPAGVPADTLEVACAAVPVNVGTEFEPAGV